VNAQTVRRLLTNLGLAVLVSQAMVLAMFYGLLKPLQLQTSDLLFRLKPDQQARWSAIVAVDDRSISELKGNGRFFGWPREFHARVIDNLKAAEARVIVWDVLFDVPTEGDAALARAIKEAGNVVLAEVVDRTTRLPSTPEQPYRFGGAIEQLPAFREAALAIGYANQLPDVDGTIRATPLVWNVAGEDQPSLPLTAAAKFLRRPRVLEAGIVDHTLPFVGRQIPLDQENRMWVGFLGDSSKVTQPPTFPLLSYVDVLNNNFPPELVRGKLVFVGMMATGFADDYWTPVSRGSKMDGVEIHANAFETIMRPEFFVVPASPQLAAGLIYAAGAIAFLALSVLHVVPAVILCTLAAAVYLAVAVTAVDRQGLLLDLPFPLLNQAFCFLAIMMYRVMFEQAQQRALKGALSQYLSPDVMEEVVRDPSAVKLGGEKREMTVLFSDIRGFTSFSETLDPERLVHFLNRYLTRMSDIIFKHEGTVDKYMGDAIMAFWGAPKAQPDHARLACLTAMEMAEELERLNVELSAEGFPVLQIGIGLNSGPMSVGNMGSERRFDYTVMGDAVNLGSRLEGLNKEYSTAIIASEATLEAAGAPFRTRFLDLVAVKGKREPTRIFELLPPSNLPAREAALAAYGRGLALYQQRSYLEALPHFAEAQRLAPDDGPTAVYLERCRELAESPPAPEWDGVYVMTRK
jgi:adenylate cyclase